MNKIGLVLSVICLSLCGVSTVSAQCNSVDQPTNLQISKSEDKALLVQWTPPENADNCDVTYNLRILHNGLPAETVETADTSYRGTWPGSCISIDAILNAKIGSDVTSGLVITNWYTGPPSEIGIVENRMIEVTATSVVITYEPPGFSNCRFVYEMIYSLDGVIVHYSTTTELVHTFNYVEEMLLCKVLSMELTAISGIVRGDTYTNNVVTDKFDVDVGSATDFSVIVTDVLEASWQPPEYYESCPVYYTLRITTISHGHELFFREDMFYDLIFDYAEQDLYCQTVVVTLTPFMRGVQGIATSEEVILAPPSEFGIVQNRLIEVTSTSVVITYEPPLDLPNCAFVYEMVYSLDGVVVHNSTTTELVHSYNYVEDMVLCKVLYMEFTAIIGDVRGEVYDNYVVTDKFDVDVGSVTDFSVTVTDVLEVSWQSPEYYESCPVYYTLRITSVPDGEELFFKQDMFNGWIFDYSEQDLYCRTVLVVVTPFMRGEQGIATTKDVTFGPPPSGSC